jgi:hypothetical protein
VTHRNLLITIVFSFLFHACSDRSNKSANSIKESTVGRQKDNQIIKDTSNTVKSTDYDFLSDSIFHGHKMLLKFYCTKYYSDSCIIQRHQKSDLKEEYEGFKSLGIIKNKYNKDSVFILRPLSYCDSDGQAYYFTDTTLPRLQTDSYCCHPNSIFLVGDIDEDGVSEIGQYYSSCASRYKSLYVYSLKGNEWKQIGHSVYDIMFMDRNRPFQTCVRKTGKKKFQMLQITDLTDDKSKIGKLNWLNFAM